MLHLDVMNAITRDYITGTSIAASTLDYSEEMRDFRLGLANRWAAWKSTHPNDILVFPEELEVGDVPDPTYDEAEDGTLTPSNADAKKLAESA